MALMILAAAIACTSVYVQTGDGKIDASTDVERSVRGRSVPAAPPEKEQAK